ncbi:hypothetical protein NQZ68_038147 [Dissostichus eleginoides]|nr:hypothetical protein NQZ68_038147 [Dissostichus eleginoides]
MERERAVSSNKSIELLCSVSLRRESLRSVSARGSGEIQPATPPGKRRGTRDQARMKKFKGGLCLVLKMMEWFSPADTGREESPFNPAARGGQVEIKGIGSHLSLTYSNAAQPVNNLQGAAILHGPCIWRRCR